MTLAVFPHPRCTPRSLGWAPTNGAGGTWVLSTENVHNLPAEGKGSMHVSGKVYTELSARACNSFAFYLPVFSTGDMGFPCRHIGTTRHEVQRDSLRLFHTRLQCGPVRV